VTDHSALWMAIDLLHAPARVKTVRSAPLPSDISALLRITAGDEKASSEAVQATGHPEQTIKEAAGFFIEQMLFYPAADSYRVLGVSPEATDGELRRNMSLLLRWLHPDRRRQNERSVFAARVTRAWNDLKTPERRAAYDRSRWLAQTHKSMMRKKSGTRNSQSFRPPNERSNGSRRVSGRAVHQRTFLQKVALLLFGRELY
jgi:hypothetical protein